MVLNRLVKMSSFVGERGLQWVSNAVETTLFSENFDVSEQTHYEVVYRSGLMTVRYYPPLAEDGIEVGEETMPVATQHHPVPILLVPPLAADPLNFDLLPNRSLVRFLLAKGFKVYLVDFGSPKSRHADYGLIDYAARLLPDAIAATRAHHGERALSLVGYCMGGLFALVYQGWAHDPDVRNIVTIATPIDSRAVGMAGWLVQAMQVPTRLIRRLTPFRIDKIDARRLMMPGWMASNIFKLTNPIGVVQGYADLLMNLWDREYLMENRTVSRWFNDMHAYPGGIVKDFVVRVGLDNALAKGKIELGEGAVSDFAAIACPYLAIAGKSDQIVTLDAARKVMDVVPSGDKQFAEAPGGHAGVFAGSRAPVTTWTIAADWLALRSAA
ncbi:alpha/beta fold hydrolase [Zavarzinia compransoris]|uniref:alpha/beta fold hydrolase n=1 Tax=Zavarzinia marina TaxID=2911065 RepID=UPI001F2D6EA2|nr:alpha/beta fold hydrolase [Zavarzinia marina]MCF4166961.1 alpha/beta fold hydrolase [Zavarzinia marina]